MSTRIRLTIAFTIMALLVVATAYSMRRWHRIRLETAEVEHSRREEARKLLSGRLKRLPTCIWVRDFLRSQLPHLRPTSEPRSAGEHSAVYGAIILAKSCVPLMVAAGYGAPSGTIRERALGWSELVDLHLRQLRIEIVRSAQ